MHPANFSTPAALFICIVLGYLALSVFVLGGKKVYFDPYIDKEDEPASTPMDPPPASVPPTM